MAIANCGGLVLDGSTLKMINGIITVSDGNPTSGITANCGGILFDATYFKKINNVITDINATSVSAMVCTQTGCGGLLLDSNRFSMVDGELVFDVLDTEAEIKTFVIDEAVGVITDDAIAVEVPKDTDVTALTPTITISNDATITPASGVEQDFTDTVDYVVTAQDGVTKTTYTVTVTVAD